MKIVREFEREILESGATTSKAAHHMIINRICKRYVDDMKERYALNTCKNYMGLMKKIIKKNCGGGNRHPALKILRLSSLEYFHLKEEYRKKITHNSKHPIIFEDIDSYIETCEDLIEGFNRSHISCTKLAIGIAGLTGRRIVVEVICFGKVKPLDKHHMMFSGQAKTMKNYEKPPYIIPVLSDSKWIYEAWKILRFMRPPIIPDEVKSDDIIKLTLDSHKINMKTHHRLFQKYRDEMRVIATKTADIVHSNNNLTARKCFSHFGVRKTSDLRALYAEAAYHMFKPSGDRNTYYSMILGHDEDDLMTPQSYKKFRKNDRS